MISLADKSKVSLFDYLYFLCIILYAGGATAFARSFGEFGTVSNAFALGFTLVFLWKNRVRFSSRFLWTLAIFSLFAVCTFVQNGRISPLWLGIWWMNFIISYALCYRFEGKIFTVFETIIYHLSIISLVLWGVYLINPEIIQSLVESLQFSESFSENVKTKNMIVYTLLDDDRQLNDFVDVSRNAGFMWEPGAFACMICLAIWCNVIRTNFTLLGNRHLIVMLLALMSTSSTTGYVIFIILLILYFIFNSKYKHILYIVPIVVLLYQLPFVKDKIEDEYVGVSDVNLAMYDEEQNFALGRIVSFQLDWEEFLRHPWLGLGGYSEGSWLNQQGYDNIATISGLGKLLSRYGAIMAIIFVILLVKSVKLVNRLYQTRSGWLLIGVMIGTMVSYDLWVQPAIMIFWLFGVWNIEANKRCL